MPITTQDYSAHKEVVFMEFGTGDIMFTKATPEGQEYDDRLLFSNQTPPRQIGDETSEHVGKSSDELDNVKVVMVFNKPESITALIHSLIELQKAVFKKQSCA